MKLETTTHSACPINFDCTFSEAGDCLNYYSCREWAYAVALPYHYGVKGLIVSFTPEEYRDMGDGFKIYLYADLEGFANPEELPYEFTNQGIKIIRDIPDYGFLRPSELPYLYVEFETHSELIVMFFDCPYQEAFLYGWCEPLAVYHRPGTLTCGINSVR